MRTAETVLGVIRVPRRRSLASLVSSKDSCGVLRGVVGKVPSGNSLAAYPTARPVLRGLRHEVARIAVMHDGSMT
jgi:hypothetical protein